MDWRRRSVVKLLYDSSTVYLFDPAGNTGDSREPQRCDAFTVVTASPNPVHYKDFEAFEGARHNAGNFYMAPWSLLNCSRCSSCWARMWSLGEGGGGAPLWAFWWRRASGSCA